MSLPASDETLRASSDESKMTCMIMNRTFQACLFVVPPSRGLNILLSRVSFAERCYFDHDWGLQMRGSQVLLSDLS